MRTQRFFGYYLTLSIGCIGAFYLWAELPHRIAARRAHSSHSLHAVVLTESRHPAALGAPAPFLLPNASLTIMDAANRPSPE